jgi:predicted amino acid dehydrogenase
MKDNWFSDTIYGLATTAIIAVGGAVSWLVRRVLTNQKQIELLEREIKHRDNQRQEDREALSEVRTSVKRIEDVLIRGRYD